MVEEILPGGEGPHAHHGKLMRMGVMSALAIAIHNFPEGIATFAAALQNPSLGIAIAVAISIHNIPEGLAVSVPIYFSTGSRSKAFRLSFLSGLAEPLGALIGYLVLSRFLNDTTFGVLFGMVAGIMVFISLDELLPAAREYGEAHRAVYSMVAGMAVMAVSLLLFV
jgi:ZIP family zinc transporter